MRNRGACTALLLAIAMVGMGCARGPSDSQIAANIKMQFSSDSQLKGTSLSVTVQKGTATLSGQVPSVAARYEAFKVASETAGVDKVNDGMTLAESATNAPTTASAPPPAPATAPAPERRVTQPRSVTPQREPAARQSASSRTPAKTPAPEAEPPASPASPTPTTATNATAAQPAPPPPERITIPQGTRVNVRMIDPVNSAVNRTGDILHASLADPIKVGKQIVAPQGADVYLRLVEVQSAGHLSGHSELRLELYRIQIQGESYPLVSNDYIDKGASRTKRTVMTILGSSAVGAAIGAIAGGGKGAAIGAAVGGGGGTVYQSATNGKQVDIAPETLLKFQLEQPASVTLSPNSSQPDSQP